MYLKLINLVVKEYAVSNLLFPLNNLLFVLAEDLSKFMSGNFDFSDVLFAGLIDQVDLEQDVSAGDGPWGVVETEGAEGKKFVVGLAFFNAKGDLAIMMRS